MPEPAISIIIAAYNDEATIGQAIRSALDQTVTNIEVVVIDDCSTDGSMAVIDGIAHEDGRVKVLHHERNKRSLEARRSGLSLAEADYVLFLDGDDWLAVDTCELLLAEEVSTPVDILQFDIACEYVKGNPSETVMNTMTHVYTPLAISATGDDVTHITYEEDCAVWALVGKLFRRDILIEAHRWIPEQVMFLSEDAYVYFLTTHFARSYRGVPEIKGYHYRVGIGDTHFGDTHMDIESYREICKSHLAADGVARFLDATDTWDRYRKDFEALCDRLLADPASRFPDNIVPDDRVKAFDLLLATWPAPDVIAKLAEFNWNTPGGILKAADGSNPTRRENTHDKTVAVYCRELREGGTEDAIIRLITLLSSMGHTVILLTDLAIPADSISLPEGVRHILLPDYIGIDHSNYRPRAEALFEALSRNQVDVLLYNQWLSHLLAWDMVVAKTTGTAFVVHTHGTFSALVGYGLPELCRLPPVYRFADGIICLSETDVRFWRHFNPKVFCAVSPTAFDIEDEEPADLNNHTVIWSEGIERDKAIHEVLFIIRQVVNSIPDARLLIVGPISSSRRKETEKDVITLGLQDNVELVGPRRPQEMPKWYRKASVFLMTSPCENSPMSLGEALAIGLPCVMYELPYLTLVQDNQGIVAVAQEDTEAAARAIVELFLDTQRRQAMGKAARTFMARIAEFDFVALWQTILASAVTEDVSPAEDIEEARMWDMLMAACSERLSDARTVRQENDSLRAECARLKDELAGFDASVSYRVGRTLTAPARALRDAGKKPPQTS